MSRFSIARKSSLAAIALGVAALGTSTMPAAALPGFSTHFIGVAGIAGLPPIVRQTIPGNPVRIPSLGPTGLNAPLQTPEQRPGGSPYGSKIIGNLNNPIGGQPQIQPLPHGVDNVCPDNPFKCPKTGGGLQGGGAGGTPAPTGGQSPIPVPPVVVSIPPAPTQVQPLPVQQVPAQPIATRPQPVTTAQQPATQVPSGAGSSNVAAAPCNCLTKQYLDDGSILFRDICTRETAMVTQDELKAQGQAQVQAQTAAK